MKKIIIVGAGPAGIAASSRLLENGFTDITILEAENRIGGRVHSVKLGDHMVDLGGQWVDGEKNNVAFELAWPLGLIERFNDNHNFSIKFYGSSGSSLSHELSLSMKLFQDSLTDEMSDIDSLKTGALGEYANAKYDEYIKSHPEISADLHEPLRHLTMLVLLTLNGADSWYDVSAKALKNYEKCDGDHRINWKKGTYSSILDILMKKIPNPEEELPVLDNTRMNSKVVKIDYINESVPVKVSTDDGKEYSADHVIFTASLGVLKANYKELFNPPLPEKKITSIENLGFGHAAKIWLYYENPWWLSDGNEYEVKAIYWTDADRKMIENDPQKKWMLGITMILPAEHKPKALSLWVSSNHAIEMESIPDELLRIQISEFIKKCFGHEYSVTEPTEIIRSLWNTNENFRGTYTYHKLETSAANVTNKDLAEPIMLNGVPVLQFAGEATSERYTSVHGAIESGWREADRLIKLYPTK